MERIEKSMEDEKVEHIKLSFAWGIASKNDIIEDFQEIYKKEDGKDIGLQLTVFEDQTAEPA
jgi:hypothetical protein